MHQVVLEDVDVDVFKIFVHWLYSGEVIAVDDEEILAREGEKKYGSTQHEALVRLYVLADRLEVQTLRNAVMDEMNSLCSKLSRSPNANAVKIAYDETPENCELRRYMIDCYACTPDLEGLKRYRQQIPDAFFADAFFRLKEAKDEKPTSPLKVDKCHYHEHNDEVPKCA